MECGGSLVHRLTLKKKKKKNYAARLKFFMMFIRLFVLVMLSIWLAKHDGI